MPENDEIQAEQEARKELTVDDLETVAGGAEEAFSSETDEIGDPIYGSKGVKST